jgi:hypothetical protein
MGKLPNGILGPIEGKVGTVIGSSRNGIPYLKGPYKKRKKKAKGGEKQNHQKFATAQNWLSPITPFLRVGFKGYTQKAPGFRGAISHLLNNGFEGVAPHQVIQPKLVKVSFGDLPLSENITVEKWEQKYLKFSWDTGIVEGGSSKDQVMLLAYNPEEKSKIMSLTGNFRGTGTDQLIFPFGLGGIYHVYLAFVSADRSSQSNSVYLGEFSTAD